VATIFFHPATFNLFTTDGVTGAGFPVPAYFAALFMGLTGHDAPGLMRGVTLAFGLGGVLEREDNQRNQSSAAATCQKAKKDTTVFS
jgi:hypothetical protein